MDYCIAFTAKNGTTHRVWNPRKADSIALAKALWIGRGVTGIVVIGERKVKANDFRTEAYEAFQAGTTIDIL